MFQENELVTFVVVLGIGVFLLVNRKRMESTTDRFLVLSFLFYAAASVCTVAETVFLPLALNLLEHLFIFLHTVSFTIWIWLLAKSQTEKRV